MVSEVSTVAPGASFTVALELRHPEEWHSYYLNSGGVEESLSIEWDLPEGFRAGPIQWPVPEVKDGYLGKSFIYSGSPVFLIDLQAPEDLSVGAGLAISANASWQICKVSCIPESRVFTLHLQTAEAVERDPAAEELFVRGRASQPAGTEGWKISAQPEGEEILLRLEPGQGAAIPEGGSIDFIPDQAFVASLSADGSLERDGEAVILRLKRNTVDFLDDPIPQGDSVSGILTGARSFLIPDTRIESPAEQPAAESGAGQVGGNPSPGALALLPILGGMFLGGLILNLMPCVFPVIGIKIMGFVQQAGHDRKKIVLHGFIFTVGVLISFWVLALALYMGGITNWGNQLQDPRVILITILIMLLFGMNLFGVFEIGTSATGIGGTLMQKQGVAGTFFSGVLATLIATPCSGPFLGVAIGAAAVLPVVPFFVAFTAMALGLSLPYLILSVFPALVEKLPRPGGWMVSFKQAMSFLLFATAGVFLWVYAAQVFDRDDGQKGLWVMIGLSAVATAAWIYGRWNQPVRSRGVRTAGIVVAGLMFTAGMLAAWPWEVDESKTASQGADLEWGTWSPGEVETLLAEGRPVFVDFTARWCLTCQLNKRRAYTGPVVEMMRKKGIVALRADKTNPNPEIEAELSALGRTAIPVNVLLVPGGDKVITPELLSPDYLLELFEDVPPAAGSEG